MRDGLDRKTGHDGKGLAMPTVESGIRASRWWRDRVGTST